MAQEYWAIPSGGSGPPPTEWTKLVASNTSGSSYTTGGWSDGNIYKTTTTAPITFTPNTTTTTDININKLLNDYIIKAEKQLKKQIEDQLFTPSPLLEHLKKREEEAVSAITDARAEREKARVNKLMDEYAEADFGGLDDGTVIRFSWRPEDSEKVYDYAAIYAGKRWYVTGSGQQRMKTSEFEDWLIERNIPASAVEVATTFN